MPRKRKEHPDRWNEPFPKRLRQLMDEQGLSHQAFGSYLGVARQSVGNYCDGSVSPSPDTLIKVANYFSVSVDYLLGRTDVRTPELDVQIASKITGLSENAIAVLHDCCGHERFTGTQKTINALLTHPDFDAVTDYWELAWHCVQESQRWHGPDLSDDDAAAKEMEALTQAMVFVREHGLAVRSWEDCAADNMAYAGDVLKTILSTITGKWCNPDPDDPEAVPEAKSPSSSQEMPTHE